MRIGSELIARATFRAHVVRQKISVTLTVAFLDVKLKVYQKLNELQQRVKRSVKAQKEKPLFLIQRLQKSPRWLLAELRGIPPRLRDRLRAKKSPEL